MGWGRPLRHDHDGTAGAGAAFLAIALAVVVVATEVPFEDREEFSHREAAGPAELRHALDAELSVLERLLHDSWRAANGSQELPAVRARIASERAAAALAAMYPREVREGILDLLEARIAVDEVSENPIPEDVGVRLVGTLRAATSSGQELTRAFDVVSRDPYHGRSTQFLLEMLDNQADDPQSEVARAVRRELMVMFAGRPAPEPADLDYHVNQALRAATYEIELHLALAKETGDAESHDALPSAPSVEFSPPDLGHLLEALNDSVFAAFLDGYLLDDGAPPAVVALVRGLLSWGAPLREAAIAAVRQVPGFLEGLLSRWLPGNSTLLPQVAELLRRAASNLAASANAAAHRAVLLLHAMAPWSAPPLSSKPTDFVRLSAHGAHIVSTRSWAPVLSRAGFEMPFCANALVEFTLLWELAIPLADGSVSRTSQTRQIRVEVSFPSAGPLVGNALVASLEALGGDRSIAIIEGIASTFSLLESLRREVDARAWKFRDAVARKTAEDSAGTFSRLLFRVVNALEDGDKDRSARALFDFLERYVADELRDALTVNFTVLGINFTLIPDPIRQQMSLEHSRGPHTFGVRVRRIFTEESPLKGKFKDESSLALELYYLYSRPPVSAGLVIDPFMRTDDGLLRFFVRSTAADGLLIQVAAPRFVRRSGIFEVSLADLMPGLGGIPIGVTPSGGILVADIGARVEIGALPIAVVAMWILRAAQDAWLDVVANQSVGDVALQFGVPKLAQRLFERFLNRFADIVVAQASQALTRADLFLKISDREAGGLVSSSVEAALSIREPLVVLRELTSDLASLFRVALAHATASHGPSPALLDVLPSAVHERVGLSLKVSIRGGLDEFLLFPRKADRYPDTILSQELFLSAGAFATLAGRVGVHWVVEYDVAWDGLSKKIPGVSWRLGNNDSVHLVHLRMEGLSGPKILLSEVSPAPRGDDSDLEFIELYNPGFSEERLTGWALTDAGGRWFVLPPDARIPAGGTLVVARSASPFLSRYGVVPAISSLTLALNDEGDHVQLVNDRGVVSDEVSWGTYAASGIRVRVEESIARAMAQRPPTGLPGSALVYTGSQNDFSVGAPTPGNLPR